MDIRIVIKRSLVYSSLLTIISLLYVAIVFLINHLLEVTLGLEDFIGSFTAALAIAVLFTPLRLQIQSMIDRIFLMASPIEIAEENALLRKEVAEKEKFKSIATLAGILVHEIKNPLTAIYTFTEYLPEKIHDPAFLRHFTRLVSHETRRINSLAQSLLQVARPRRMDFRPCDINALLADIIDLIEPQCRKHKIRIVKAISPSMKTVHADPDRIRQAVLNLLLNAIEAMPEGGVLTIEAHEQPSSKDPEEIVIDITDTGPGLSPEEVQEIFEPFFTTKKDGSGLGLAITRSIIEEHGGRISAHPQPHSGARFIVILPTKRAESH